MSSKEDPPVPRIRAYPGVGKSIEPRDKARKNTAWEIVICGDLTERQSDLLTKLTEVAPGSRGLLYFDSAGGSAYTGLALASMIRLRGLDAIGVVASECSSAAIMPLAACKSRFVTAHASLLFHPIRWQSDEQVRLEEAVEWARHFQLMEEDQDALMAKLFECDRQLIDKWNRPGRFVSGTEFAEAGLAKMINMFDGDIWTQMAALSQTKKSEPRR